MQGRNLLKYILCLVLAPGNLIVSSLAQLSATSGFRGIFAAAKLNQLRIFTHRLRMATPRKHGKRWRIDICVRGNRESRIFDTKDQCVKWSILRSAELGDGKMVKGVRLADAIDRYAREVSPSKKGWRWELVRLNKFKRYPIANLPVSAVNLDDAENLKVELLKTLKPDSVIREFNILKRVLRLCVKWKYIKVYPWTGLEMPRAGAGRDRIFTDAEISRIVKASGADKRPIITRTQETGIMFLFACETAMRRSEITSQQWDNINLDARTSFLPDTKNEESRTVPLSTKAVKLIRLMPRERIKPFTISPDTASTLFKRICKQAKVEGARFHDSRHHGTTKLAEKLDMLTLARVTGHKDPRMLLRYFNKPASEIAKMLD